MYTAKNKFGAILLLGLKHAHFNCHHLPGNEIQSSIKMLFTLEIKLFFFGHFTVLSEDQMTTLSAKLIFHSIGIIVKTEHCKQ